MYAPPYYPVGRQGKRISPEMAQLQDKLTECLQALADSPPYWLKLLSRETLDNSITNDNTMHNWHRSKTAVNTAELLQCLALIGELHHRESIATHK